MTLGAVPRPAMLRKEIRRFPGVTFHGAAAPLVAHLADMNEVSLEDLRAIEKHVARQASRPRHDGRNRSRFAKKRRERGDKD